jgi:hypothetical protein
MDRQSQTRRNPSQLQQPSPALVPQQTHIGAAPSPILAPQSSSPTQMTPSNDWKPSWHNDPPSPTNEGSTSQKVAVITPDNSIRVSSNIAENDVSSSSQADIITTNSNTISNNDTVNSVSENNDNQMNANVEGSNWADQTQESSTNWQKESDLNESNQVNDNLNSEEGSSSTNNNTTVSQNRNQYNNNRRNKNQLSVYVGNLTPPVSEEELKDFFTSQIDCQVIISLIF